MKIVTALAPLLALALALGVTAVVLHLAGRRAFDARALAIETMIVVILWGPIARARRSKSNR